MSDDNDHADEATREAAQLVDLIKPLFAFRDPEVVGAVLGQLLAKLIAGHCPEMREEAMNLVIDMARDLVPIEIDEQIEAGAVPPEWRGTKQ
ncbi:hypothetical protein [Bradyrhizobium sp. 170]|uniref:hypothetical protein n=1 Tax=Bradyrhizobium sp. 170 TaxID=2782641 RepID=UPI001FFE9766|nr:hypothetical protein [Bradyrhizobium sp. 170]UPK03078.1 hypothetical protein IVB05_36970 [Bradyrhizobium sp. 170]